MLNRTLTTLLVLFATTINAQVVKTDTVKQGYYVPLDSNLMSCKIEVTPKGKKMQLTYQSGNKLPDSTIQAISRLEPGSVVIYSELTVHKKGILEKAPSVRYVIGSKNTCVVKRDPSYPDTLAAKEIASLELDRHVYSFSVSWIADGNMYNYDLTGNGVFGAAGTAIEALPSGTKVYFENIRRQEDDGSKRIAPSEIYIVK